MAMSLSGAFTSGRCDRPVPGRRRRGRTTACIDTECDDFDFYQRPWYDQPLKLGGP